MQQVSYRSGSWGHEPRVREKIELLERILEKK